MTKRQYLMAIACYLAIPVVMIAGAGVSRSINPEWALGSADYGRNFRLLEMVQGGVVMAAAGVMIALWALSCLLVIQSRQRSLLLLLLAAAGPLGFMFIAMLPDRSPAPDDLYQQFVGKLKMVWRIPLEIVLFVTIWFIGYQCVALKGELLISYQSWSSGKPVAAIVAEQDASSGMWAFGEALETMFLVPLIYLLWPIVFNLAGRRFKS